MLAGPRTPRPRRWAIPAEAAGLALHGVLQVVGGAIAALSLALLCWPRSVHSQPAPLTDPFREPPLEAAWLNLPPTNQPPHIVTMTPPAPTGVTDPSLWWLRDQLEVGLPPRLILQWLAYPQAPPSLRRVDVVVNQVRWSDLAYAQRYALLHQLGLALQAQGYQVRLFDEAANGVGWYYCDPVSPPCQVWVDTTGRGSWRGRSPSPFAAPSATDATGLGPSLESRE